MGLLLNPLKDDLSLQGSTARSRVLETGAVLEWLFGKHGLLQ